MRMFSSRLLLVTKRPHQRLVASSIRAIRHIFGPCCSTQACSEVSNVTGVGVPNSVSFSLGTEHYPSRRHALSVTKFCCEQAGGCIVLVSGSKNGNSG
jgi:hypothetical protein